MWTYKQTELTHSKSDGDCRGERQKLYCTRFQLEKWLHSKFFPWDEWKQNTSEGGLKLNAYVCAYLCLYVPEHGPFWWHLCYMLPLPQHVRYKSQWPGKSSTGYFERLKVSLIGMPLDLGYGPKHGLWLNLYPRQEPELSPGRQRVEGRWLDYVLSKMGHFWENKRWF